MSSEEIARLQQELSDHSDQRALEKLYRHFHGKLFRFARALVRQHEAAEEIVEDIFVRLWERRLTVSEIGNLQVYLYVAVRNRALNYLNWKSRDIISYVEMYPVDIPASQDSPDSVLMTKEMSARINQAVDGLPARCKLIFKLVREEKMKYREVAEVLDISVRTVDTQMTIAMKKLAATITLYTASTL
jgi:RNA polymerase sigma-70 factor (ECF subfamily)